MADGSRHSISYVKETVYGVTPASPIFNYLRALGGVTLGLGKEELESQELRSDRMLQDFRQGASKVEGDIPFELSYGSFDDFLEAAFCGTWLSDTLKIGATRRSFTIERLFADLFDYHRFRGCEIGGFSLSIPANAMVTGSFQVLGAGMDPIASTVITGASYPAGSTTKPLDSFTGTISEGGVTIAVVTSISLTLENGLAQRMVVGSKESLRPSIGRAMVSGEVTAYFESETLMNKFINENESSIVFTLPDFAGNEYTFTIPRIVYTGGAPDVADEGPITLTMPFKSLRDAASQTVLQLQRTDA